MSKQNLVNFFVCGLLWQFFSGPAYACDPCSLYNASRLQGHEANSWNFSVSEQLTSYDRAAAIVQNSEKDAQYVEQYSTTQFSLARDFSHGLGLQVTVPLIGRYVDTIRNYREFETQDGGIGDVSLLGSATLLNENSGDSQYLLAVYTGVKFPTGDTGDIEEATGDASSASLLRHHPITSSSGGRVLSEGTGSYDAIFGTSFLTRHEKWLLLGYAQYTLRTEGDFDYEFGDDTLWSIAPGRYFALENNYSLAGTLAFSGEHKPSDERDGEDVQGSKISNLYLGPQILLTFGGATSFEFTWDFRTTGEDKDSLVVPDQRIRASLAYRF